MSNKLLSNVISTCFGALIAIAAVSGQGVSPIQITTQTPHPFGSGDWIAVAGVQGNTAANQDNTITVIDSFNFTVPGTGSGAYAGGGTCALLYGVATQLQRAGHAPLLDSVAPNNSDGRTGMPIGPQYLVESLDFPRIIIVPTDLPFGGRAGFNSQMLVSGQPIQAAQTNPPIASMTIRCSVEVWGADYDDCLDMASQFVRSAMWVLSTGNLEIGTGRWLDTTRVALRGRWLSFPVSWIAAITRYPISVPGTLAPSGTAGTAKVYIDNAGNPTGQNPVTVND